MVNVLVALAVYETFFLEKVAPMVKRKAKFVFRHQKGDAFAECQADAMAWAWQGMLWVIGQGKDPTSFPTVIAEYAIRRTKSKRKVGKKKARRDVYHGMQVIYLDEWHEALTEDDRTPVLDQVAFRIDFPEWLKTLTSRNRKLAESLMIGHKPSEVAEQLGMTRVRVTQVRHELKDDWQRFTD